MCDGVTQISKELLSHIVNKPGYLVDEIPHPSSLTNGFGCVQPIVATQKAVERTLIETAGIFAGA
jgi:hypothetical protein